MTMGVAGESRASQRRDLLVDSASIGSSGGVLSLASEAHSLARLKASQKCLALGKPVHFQTLSRSNWLVCSAVMVLWQGERMMAVKVGWP